MGETFGGQRDIGGAGDCMRTVDLITENLGVGQLVMDNFHAWGELANRWRFDTTFYGNMKALYDKAGIAVPEVLEALRPYATCRAGWSR